MSTSELIITILGLALSGIGLLAYKAFLNARTHNKVTDAEMQTRIALSEEETRRLEIMRNILESAKTGSKLLDH